MASQYISSQYISKENQAILWNTIQAYPNFKLVASKEQWFKDVIHKFYTPVMNKSLVRDELHQLNKKTIQFMIADIRSMTSEFKDLSNNSKEVNDLGNILPEVIVRDNKIRTESLVKQFASRQQEYGDYLQKPPAEVDFRLVEKDEPITNIESLIQQHLNERDRDLQLYMPPPNTNVPLTVSIGEKSVSFKESLKYSTEDLSTEDLSTKDLSTKDLSTEDERFEMLKREITQELEAFKLEIRELVKEMRNNV